MLQTVKDVDGEHKQQQLVLPPLLLPYFLYLFIFVVVVLVFFLIAFFFCSFVVFVALNLARSGLAVGSVLGCMIICGWLHE